VPPLASAKSGSVVINTPAFIFNMLLRVNKSKQSKAAANIVKKVIFALGCFFKQKTLRSSDSEGFN